VRSPRYFRSVVSRKSSTSVVPLHRIFAPRFLRIYSTFASFPSRVKRFTRESTRAEPTSEANRLSCLFLYLRLRPQLCGCSSRYKWRNEKERKRHPPFVLRSSSRRSRWKPLYACACMRVCVHSLVRVHLRCNITYSLTTGYGGGSNLHKLLVVYRTL